MNYEERLRLIARIVSGYTTLSYLGDTYIVYDPSILDYFESDAYYNDSLEDLCAQGFLTIDQSNILLSEKSLWTPQENAEIENIVSNIKRWQKDIQRLTFKSLEKLKVQQAIKDAERKLQRLNAKKNSLFFYTANYNAMIERYRYLLYKLSYDKNGNKKWNSLEDLKQENDKFINHLIQEVFFQNNIDIKTLRELARSDPWRNMWLAANKVSNLFKRPVVELTDLQRDLVSWSMIYDNVYESHESPSQDVIDNDVLLDAWFEEQSNKRNRENGDKFVTNNEKIKNAREVGIVVDSHEDAEKVYNLNDHLAKKEINQNLDFIKERGQVKDVHLPGKKQELFMEASKLYKDKMNAIQ